MARIKDLFSAIVSSNDGFEDVVRIITAAGHSAELVHNESLAGALNWGGPQGNNPAMRSIAAQGVAYKKVNLKSGISRHAGGQGNINPLNMTERVNKFLHEFQIRGELNYPFAVIDSSYTLFISVVDFDNIIMALARELQMQKDQQAAIIPPAPPAIPLTKL